MTVKPINNIVKQRFQVIFNAAIQQAENDFASRVEKQIVPFDLFNQIKFVTDELNSVENIIEASEYPFYIENHSSEDWLLNQFASRSVLMNVDESKQLKESIYLGAYRKLIYDLKYDLKGKIPAYNYNDFLSGIIDPFLSNFEKIYNVSEEEYYKIKKWQSDYLMKIVSYESLMLIRKIQQHCVTLKEPLEFIIAENEKIANKLDNTQLNGEVIKSVLGEMFIFDYQNPSHYNNKFLTDNFLLYKAASMNWKDITPEYLNPLIQNIDLNTTTIFSNEVTVFFTINKIAEWFEDIIAGQSIQQLISEPNWENLFKTIEEDALFQIEKLEEEITNYVEDPERTEEEIKEYLIDQLEKYRDKFNCFQDKYIFALLKEERRHTLKVMFRTNSFFGNALETLTKEITEALIIQEVSWVICGIYGSIFDTHRMDFPDNGGEHIEIMYLMHQMILDKELHNEMSKIMDDFMQHFHSYFLPIEIHFQNNRTMMKDLFYKSLERLQTHLDDAEQSNKILFMQSRLKQLRHREFEWKKHERKKYFNKRDFHYSKLFKEFLEIEAEFIRETRDSVIMISLPLEEPIMLLESKTKQVISAAFKSIDENEGWRYAFKSENDCFLFVDLLTCHFESRPYSIPQTEIKLKRNSKTRFAKVLNPIHKELSEISLKSDSNFFRIIKVLNHFKDLTDSEIYQAITR